MRNRVIAIVVLFLSMNLNLFAIEGKIRVFIPSENEVYTSQKITVAVELLSSAFSITDARITFPASDKYIVQAPNSASYLGQERINGESWQMVHYDYEIYALKAGRVEIPSVSVSFTASMGYGQPKEEFDLQSDALAFNVKVPEGAREDQFVLVTDNFKLSSEIKPEKEKLIVGDAIELSVTQKANDVPDLLLTPITYISDASLRVYEKEPILERGIEGTFDVSRTDSFTFVASMEGNVTVPAQEIVWYNPESKKIHVETIPAMKYEIIPDPQIAIDAKKAQKKLILMYLGTVLLVIVMLYLIFASKIRRIRKERMRMYEESEAGKFAALLSMIESGNVSAIDKQFYLWLLSASPELIRGGMKSIEMIDPSFAEVLREFDQSVINIDRGFDGLKFSSELKRFREKLLKDKESTKQGLPVTINP